MRVIDLLVANNRMNKEIDAVNYHMNLLNCDVDYLKSRIPELKDLSDVQILEFVVDAFDKCDQRSSNYDAKLDVEMTRIGLKTDVFYTGRRPGKWNTQTLSDDDFTDITDIYDSNVDLENERQPHM